MPIIIKTTKTSIFTLVKIEVGTLVGYADKILEDIDYMMEEVDSTDIQEK